MGKAPAFQFYVNDWMKDLLEHPLEIRGVWITILCKLWWSETRGTLSLSWEQWSRILGVDIESTKSLVDYVKVEKIGDVTERNGKITITSRRMLRDEKERINNALRQKRYRQAHYSNNNSNAKVTPVSSSSSSNTIYMQHFETFWECYPKRNNRKVGKKQCHDWWIKKARDDSGDIIRAAENYAAADEVKRGYAKDPIRFLKADYWKDWLEPVKKDPAAHIPMYSGKKEYWEDG